MGICERKISSAPSLRDFGIDLWNPLSPTLKRGAIERCASGALIGSLLMLLSMKVDLWILQ
jgi:hypothetical protein